MTETSRKQAPLKKMHPIEADHFVLSPGAYGHNLLRGTRAAGAIQGVLGVWITLPNVDPPLTCSLKIRREKYVTPDTNVTVVKDPSRGPVLILGAGYGWTGARPQNIDLAELEAIFLGVQDTARVFFPTAYEVACSDGGMQRSRRWCVRPWTAANLGIFETIPTVAGGKLVVTGGHNTGGFSQAPAVAAAVLAALRDRSHPMHSLYDPLRPGRELRRISAGSPLEGT